MPFSCWFHWNAFDSGIALFMSFTHINGCEWFQSLYSATHLHSLQTVQYSSTLELLNLWNEVCNDAYNHKQHRGCPIVRWVCNLWVEAPESQGVPSRALKILALHDIYSIEQLPVEAKQECLLSWLKTSWDGTRLHSSPSGAGWVMHVWAWCHFDWPPLGDCQPSTQHVGNVNPDESGLI